MIVARNKIIILRLSSNSSLCPSQSRRADKNKHEVPIYSIRKHVFRSCKFIQFVLRTERILAGTIPIGIPSLIPIVLRQTRRRLSLSADSKVVAAKSCEQWMNAMQ